MGILNNLFKAIKKINENAKELDISVNKEFNEDEYNNYNKKKIDEFKKKYDLSTIEGINSISIQEAKKYPDGGKSVVYMPEQILSRQATEYKNNGQYDLAIACLKKVNELYPYSFYSYTREDYERLVNIMVLAGKYKEAKEEHNRLNKLYGTRLEELKKLQKFAEETKAESQKDYQKRVIDPYIEEESDREQYYWLLENMPSIAPKSFSGYRRMKRMNSSNYQKIILEVKKTSNDLNKIKFWN